MTTALPQEVPCSWSTETCRLRYPISNIWTQQNSRPFGIYWSDNLKFGRLWPEPTDEELASFYDVSSYGEHLAGTQNRFALLRRCYCARPLYRRAVVAGPEGLFAQNFQAGIRARIAERTYLNPWGNVMPTDMKDETAMKHLVLVRAIGIELDSLRGAASRVAGETETEWWTEPRPLGTAFCFESANTRTQFCAICARHDVDYTTEG
jgi:hypothetical protein